MYNAIFGSINFNDPLLEFFKFQSLSDKGDVADRQKKMLLQSLQIEWKMP